MAATIEQLEERVSRLERKVAALKAERDQNDERPWWERIAGDFADDEAFEQRLFALVRNGGVSRGHRKIEGVPERDQNGINNRTT